MTRGPHYVVLVQTKRGWATITQPAHRKNAHSLAARLGGKVFNLYMKRESKP